MAQLQVTLTVRPKWWLAPALYVGFALFWLGLIPDAASAEHFDGRITGEERLGKWLADFAFRVEVA